MHSKKLKIGLIGYGKMGKTIEKIALDRFHTVVLKTSSSNPLSNCTELLKDLDVAIEFTNPEIAADNLNILAQHKVPTVCGSTAWLDRYEETCALFTQNDTPFIYASNFSIGVNIFFSVNKHLAKLMDRYSDYNVTMTESHHIEKKDAPSGTAVSLANQITESLARKSSWHLSTEDKSNSIEIEAIRRADVKGEHGIRYTNSIDEITIRHEAFSRDGFASGAIMASEWIIGKNGIFTMKDVMNL